MTLRCLRSRRCDLGSNVKLHMACIIKFDTTMNAARLSLDPLATALARPYRHGFVTEIETDTLPPGLNEDTIRETSRRKREPAFVLNWRLAAFKRWLAMREPAWARLHIAALDFQAHSYYAAPSSATWRAAPRRSATSTSCTPRWSN